MEVGGFLSVLGRRCATWHIDLTDYHAWPAAQHRLAVMFIYGEPAHLVRPCLDRDQHAWTHRLLEIVRPSVVFKALYVGGQSQYHTVSTRYI